MELDNEIAKLLNTERVTLATIGYSNEKVYFLDRGYQGKDVVLKTSKRKEVLKEGMILSWLYPRIKTPKVYINKCIDGVYYLVMEKLEGQMMQETIFDSGIKEGIIQYALLIKRIHQIPYQDFPFITTLEDRVVEAKYNVENDLVKTQYFERELKDKSAEEVYELLIRYYPQDEDKVLVHGDVCMPNFIMHLHQLSGIIDVGRMGVNDRYLDIAIALRTLRYNIELYGDVMTKEDINLFLDTYGIKNFNREKFIFYILLDELING